MSFLAKKVDEMGLPCVLTIEGKNHKLTETIVQSTAAKNQKVLTMDSMQSTTAKDVANGATCLLYTSSTSVPLRNHFHSRRIMPVGCSKPARLWTKIPGGVSDATGKHGPRQRLRCSSQFQTYPPQLRQRWRRSLGWGRW